MSEIKFFASLILVGALAAGYAYTIEKAYDKGYSDSENYFKAKQQQVDHYNNMLLNEQRHRFDYQYANLQNKLNSNTQTAKTIIKERKVEIEKPIYRDCVLPDSGVQFINNSADSLNAKRIPQ